MNIEPLKNILELSNNQQDSIVFFLNDDIKLKLNNYYLYEKKNKDIFINQFIICIKKRDPANIKEVNSDKTNTVSNLEDQKSNNKQSFYESDLLNETREKGLNYYKNIPTWWKRIRSIIRHLKQ